MYLPSSGAAAVSPAFDAAWERTADAARRECVTAKTSTPMTTVTVQEPPSDEHESLAAQYVSKQLSGSGTLSGTVKGQMRVAENDADATVRAQMIVRVVSSDGATVRGTALPPDTSSSISNEFATTLTNRKFPKGWSGAGTALTSVAYQTGDRLVIELGAHASANPFSSDQYEFRVGDTGGTDLPEDETTTADNVPWIEFSQTLAFTTATGSAVFSGGGDIAVGAGISGPDYDFQAIITF